MRESGGSFAGALFTFPPSRAYRMAMPATVERYWTADAVRALPDDGKRYECIDGELLVTPSPRGLHQIAILALVRALDTYVTATAVGTLLIAPADVELESGTLVQPDLFVARLKAPVRRFRDWSEIDGVRLAIEVLSPSTARYDRRVKRQFYLRAGVEEYWIIDLDARLVERWVPGAERPEVIAERLVWRPAGVAAALEVDLDAFFSSLLDD